LPVGSGSGGLGYLAPHGGCERGVEAREEFAERQAALREVLTEGRGGRFAVGVAGPQVGSGGHMVPGRGDGGLRDEPVVAAKPAGRHFFAVDADQPGRAQPVQGGLQGPDSERDPAAGDLLDVADDAVPVLAAARQRGQDQQGRFLQAVRGHGGYCWAGWGR
jgi:hypothetical protein